MGIKIADQNSVDAILDAIMYAGQWRHFDNLASGEFVFNVISVFVELVRQSQVLLRGQERRQFKIGNDRNQIRVTAAARRSH